MWTWPDGILRTYDTSWEPSRAGLDPKHKQLLFFKSSPESRQDVLRLPPSAVQTLGQLEVRTDFTDVHLYIFDRQLVTELLDQRPQMTSIKQVHFEIWEYCRSTSRVQA